MLLDEQAVCYDMCLKTMAKCREDGKKRTIVIQGGPGTGKSVLAVNLLMEFINKSLNASYVTKNSAPRNAFLSLLTHSDAKKLVDIKQLFRSPFGLANVPADTYDCVVLKKVYKKETLYGDKMLPGGLAATPEAFYFVLAVGLWQPRRCLPLPPDSRL